MFIAHTKETDTLSLGNDRAGKAAKYTVQNGSLSFLHPIYKTVISLADTIDYQQMSHNLKKDKWIQKGAKQLDYTLGQPDFDLVPFLLTFLSALVSLQMGYVYRWEIVKELKDNWFCSNIYKVSDQIISQCTTSKSQQISRRNQITLESLPRPTLHLVVLQMDFINLPPALGYSHSLVVVCSVGGLNAIQIDRLMLQEWWGN